MARKLEKTYMGIDQLGNTYHGLANPRKDLLDRLGRKKASNMYVDLKSGGRRHAGYVIGGHWIDVYEVKPFKTGTWKRKRRSCRGK